VVDYVAESTEDLEALTALRDLLEHIPNYGLSVVSVSTSEKTVSVSGKIPEGEAEHLGVKEVV